VTIGHQFPFIGKLAFAPVRQSFAVLRMSLALQGFCSISFLQGCSTGGHKDPDLSPDGRFLVVSSDDEHNGKHFLRLLDLQRGTSTRLTDSGDEHYPLWSRDGKRIAYRSGGVTAESYEVPADGSEPPKILLKADMHAGPQDWSPDGRLLFMTVSEQNTFPSLGIYSPSDQKVESFVVDGVEAKLSPDGRWVVYVGVGRGILVERFPGHGGRMQVSAGAGAQPRWSHDGRQIFFIQPDRKLIAVSFDPNTGTAGPPRVLFQTASPPSASQTGNTPSHPTAASSLTRFLQTLLLPSRSLWDGTRSFANANPTFVEPRDGRIVGKQEIDNLTG
jgi:Tol biopolymer transport system component